MTLEKAKGPGYEDLHYRFDDMLERLVADFKAGKALDWPVLRKRQVKSVWASFARDGYVRDERALDNIFASIRDNVVRLQIANIVSGHEVMSPEDLLAEHMLEDEQDRFFSWLVDYEGGWRISDYGIGPLQDAVALAFEARTPAARLKYLDRALHVTHMRGDLSKLFIEGGRSIVASLEQRCKDEVASA
ncbi:hypothetical protein F6X40_34635 [Paraburkholderia sp. UCT31]|uniref:hypothetical protein n=1 Tax=Paraburkholderia sp. UCT31 TaxID=2615209 RepID=UPI00165565BF|nr:hypothetical protein [Paraburkholderia sp. UCT31]MBC8741701.1 hypothetical protein [Paraburkholderia sp. UCT31]